MGSKFDNWNHGYYVKNAMKNQPRTIIINSDLFQNYGEKIPSGD